MNPDPLLNLSEVATLLGNKSEKTVRRMIASGELPSPVKMRGLLIPASELADFIQKAKDSRKK